MGTAEKGRQVWKRGSQTGAGACSPMALLADFDHDGRVEVWVAGAAPAGRFGVVMPVARAPVGPVPAEGLRQEPGGIDPLQVGRVVVRFAPDLPGASELILRVCEPGRGWIHVLASDREAWRHLGASGEWRWQSHDLHGRDLLLSLIVVPPAEQPPLPWPRDFTVQVSLLAPDGSAWVRHNLPFRVAPFLLASALDPVEEVLIVANPRTVPVIAALRPLLEQAGARLQELRVPDGNLSDVWLQDAVEIGRIPVPGPEGGEQAVAALAGLRARFEGLDCRPLDAAVRAELEERGALVIAAGEPRAGTRWIDWYGNLEVSPPVRARDGREFPFGRALVGAQREMTLHPGVLQFLEAQGWQTPALQIDTSWLLIGHVDEVVNFVPAKGSRGFCVLVPSPAVARRLLEQTAAAGGAMAPVFAGTGAQTTVAQLLEEVARSDECALIEERLAQVRARLQEGLGMDTRHMIEVPALFKDGVAVIPNMVNGLICNGHAILPDPRGPRLEGQDLFASPVQQALARSGVTSHLLDVWEPYHVRAGELHCGTNAIRRLRQAAWWETLSNGRPEEAAGPMC